MFTESVTPEFAPSHTQKLLSNAYIIILSFFPLSDISKVAVFIHGFKIVVFIDVFRYLNWREDTHTAKLANYLIQILA